MRERVKIRTKCLMERQTESTGGTKELINQEERKEKKEKKKRGGEEGRTIDLISNTPRS